MRRGSVSSFTTRLRMERIGERSEETKMPPIEKLFRAVPSDPDLLKLMVENMTFSDYPGAKMGNMSSVVSLLMNSNNIDQLRQSGCLGAIVEILRRTDIEGNPGSEDVANLVQSLHIINDGDQSVQRRLMNHPMGLASIIRLCKYTSGLVQQQAFDLLEWLGKLEADSTEKLLEKNIIKILLKPAFMYRPTTLRSVRRRAAQMVRSLVMAAPDRMRIYDFADICIDPVSGKRRIDGDMEVWLMYATERYLVWWTKTRPGECLPKIFTLFKHLLEELLSESFESIEHMQLILKCCSMVSHDPHHIRFLLENGLNPALQYLVRTDFSLFAPKVKRVVDESGSEREKLKKMASKFKTKKKSVFDSGERAPATLLFLSLLRPQNSSGAVQAKHEDINLFVTKYVCSLFENIIEYDTLVIAELVGSGLVPALVFRVGKGKDRDLRFNKVVVHFLHELLRLVTFAQPHGGYHMSQFKALMGDGAADKANKKAFFWPRGRPAPPAPSTPSPPSPQAAKSLATTAFETGIPEDDDMTATTTPSEVSRQHKQKMRQQATDLQVISNTLYAHRAVEVLFATLRTPALEDPSVVREAAATLAMFKYTVMNETAIHEDNLDALFLIYRARPDCFYQFLSILCDMIQCAEIKRDTLEELVNKHRVVRILVRCLQLSGWVFHEKDRVYRCFGPLTVLPNFAQLVREVQGISVLCREVSLRKHEMRKQRRQGIDEDGDGTEKLLHALREEMAVIRIQAGVRARRSYRRVCVLLGKGDPVRAGRGHGNLAAGRGAASSRASIKGRGSIKK